MTHPDSHFEEDYEVLQVGVMVPGSIDLLHKLQLAAGINHNFDFNQLVIERQLERESPRPAPSEAAISNLITRLHKSSFKHKKTSGMRAALAVKVFEHGPSQIQLYQIQCFTRYLYSPTVMAR